MRLVIVLFLALAAPASAQPHLRVLVERAHVQHGEAIIPVRCVGGTCRLHPWAVLRGDVRALFVRVAPGARRVTSMVRVGRRRQRITLPVTRRRDVERCGYGPTTETLDRAGSQRLLAFSLDGAGIDDGDIRLIVLCLRGRARTLTATDDSSIGGDRLRAAALSNGWASLVIEDFDHYDTSDVRLVAYRSGTGRPVRRYLGGYESSAVPRYPGLAMSARGVPVVAQRAAGKATITAYDTRRGRTLDSGPGVDAASLAVYGSTAQWLADGVEQSAPLSEDPE